MSTGGIFSRSTDEAVGSLARAWSDTTANGISGVAQVAKDTLRAIESCANRWRQVAGDVGAAAVTVSEAAQKVVGLADELIYMLEDMRMKKGE